MLTAQTACLASTTSLTKRIVAIPISYSIDVENGLVLSQGQGVVTGSDLLEYIAAVGDNATVPRPLRDLHDLSRVERFEVGSNDFKTVVAAVQDNPRRVERARLAIVAPKDLVFGMYRMFELLAENSPAIEELRQSGRIPQAEVFRHRAEAQDWLLGAGGDSR